ncbi:hypothetical protein P3S68_001566 [Capsicum galapagoense]
MKYKEKHPNLDLKPNRSSPPWVISMERSSPSSSCVSREPSPDEEFSKKTAMSMMLMGCPGCLMYVIISEENPKCPRCKSTVLLDFFKEERIKNSKT